MNCPKELKIRNNFNLKFNTTFKIGGVAKYFCEPKDLKGLKSILLWANKNKLPVFVLGAGSNILVNDKEVKGLVIRLRSSFFKNIFVRKDCIYAGAGALISQIISFAKNKSLAGLEFLSGIPGTLGGAIVMNAGCWDKDISRITKEVMVIDYFGNIKILKKNKLKFEYRNSNLSKYVILSAVLKLNKGDAVCIKKNIIFNLKNKCLTQDLTSPSAGCIFKNPKGKFAGRLIDQCSLKGKRINDAVVSSKHANFILNKGKASSGDVLRLIKLIQRKVKQRFNINLEPEIKIW